MSSKRNLQAAILFVLFSVILVSTQTGCAITRVAGRCLSLETHGNGSSACYIKSGGYDLSNMVVRPGGRKFTVGLYYTPPDVVPVNVKYHYAGRKGNFSMNHKKKVMRHGYINWIKGVSEVTLTVQIIAKRIESKIDKEKGIYRERLSQKTFVLATRTITIEFVNW